MPYQKSIDLFIKIATLTLILNLKGGTMKRKMTLEQRVDWLLDFLNCDLDQVLRGM
jgi:hypothetical protein